MLMMTVIVAIISALGAVRRDTHVGAKSACFGAGCRWGWPVKSHRLGCDVIKKGKKKRKEEKEEDVKHKKCGRRVQKKRKECNVDKSVFWSFLCVSI